MLRNLMIIFAVLILFASISTAATVSIDSYTKSCKQCSFDASGKMDKACWEGIQGEAKTSLGFAYPAMSFAYTLGGGCSALDSCIGALTTCKSLYTTGQDLTDCSRGNVYHCFKKADLCAEAANKVCTEGKTEDESGLNGILNNMTTVQPDSYDEILVDSDKDKGLDEFLSCLFGFVIVGFTFVGTMFYRRN